MALNGQVRLQAGSACVLQATNVDSPVAKGGISWALQPDMRRPIRLAPMATAASAFWELGQGAPMDLQPCVGIPRIPDFSKSEFSSENTWNATTSGFACELNFENPTIKNHVEPYVPFLVENNASTSRYIESRATNHVCQAASVLNIATQYSGNIPLLIGDGTYATIANVRIFKLR